MRALGAARAESDLSGQRPGNGGLVGTDEKYHVVGGNDQIPARMASQLPQGSIQTGMLLVGAQREQ